MSRGDPQVLDALPTVPLQDTRDLAAAQGCSARHTAPLPTPWEGTFPPTVLPTHCLSPLHSSGMRVGTLPRQRNASALLSFTLFQAPVKAVEQHPPCLQALQNPAPELPREKWGVRGVKGSQLMLGSAYQEPSSKNSPWSPKTP